jgi:predicted hydrocarbon binding protein
MLERKYIDSDSLVVFYHFDGKLNLEKIKKKFPASYSDKNLLLIKIGKLDFIIFRDGHLRIVHESRDENLLLKEMQGRITEVNNFLNEIRKISKIKNEPKIVEDREIELKRDLNFEGEEIVKELCKSAELVGEYQKERIETQAGEILGRKIKVSNKKELVKKITEKIRDLKVGIPEAIDEKDTYFSIVVYQSIFSYGSKFTGKKSCNFIRGLIRGATCKFLNAENVNVVESKCFSAGDVYCKFDVYLI